MKALGPMTMKKDVPVLDHPRLQASLPKLWNLAKDPDEHQTFEETLVGLGFSKLGQRVKIKNELLALDTEPKIDWSKSDFYLEAEALAEQMPWRAEEEQKKKGEWWIVAADRVAIREGPKRSAKALTVWRKTAVVRVAIVEPQAVGDLGCELWAKLDEEEHKHIITGKPLPKGTDAWILTFDGDLGDLMTRIPEADIRSTPSGTELADALFVYSTHPEQRGAAAADKAAIVLKEIEEREKNRPKGKPPSEEALRRAALLEQNEAKVAESDPGLDADVDEVMSALKDGADLDAVLDHIQQKRDDRQDEQAAAPRVAKYTRPAGPPRPPPAPANEDAQVEVD